MERNIKQIFEWSPVVGLVLFGLTVKADAEQSYHWVCNAANDAACNLLGRMPLIQYSLSELLPFAVAQNLSDGALVYPLNDVGVFFVSVPDRWLLASGNRYLTVSGDHEIILFDHDIILPVT
jgi:hypothetical protein